MAAKKEKRLGIWMEFCQKAKTTKLDIGLFNSKVHSCKLSKTVEA